MNNNIFISICARGGSKGIPGKNIKSINGKPLISYTIESAKEFARKHSADLGLSTDSELIRNVAAEYGLLTSYVRPKLLATDTAGKIGAIHDLLEFHEKTFRKKYDFILDMDITSPLRTQEDLEKAFSELVDNKEALNIFSVNSAARNPYFNMVEESSDGYVKLVKDSGKIKSRQVAPQVYDMNASFYFFRRSFFSEGYETSITAKSLAYVMNHLCFDLDEPHDFVIMDLMMSHNLFDFKF